VPDHSLSVPSRHATSVQNGCQPVTPARALCSERFRRCTACDYSAPGRVAQHIEQAWICWWPSTALPPPDASYGLQLFLEDLAPANLSNLVTGTKHSGRSSDLQWKGRMPSPLDVIRKRDLVPHPRPGPSGLGSIGRASASLCRLREHNER